MVMVSYTDVKAFTDAKKEILYTVHKCSHVSTCLDRMLQILIAKCFVYKNGNLISKDNFDPYLQYRRNIMILENVHHETYSKEISY